MRLLVTRPEPDGERTANELRARGHHVMLAPVLHVEIMGDADLGSGPWAAVLITSANGARAVASHPRRTELMALPMLAVGQASAEAARDAGFLDVSSADGDGGDLVRLATARFAPGGRPLLYLAGEERAHDLAGELAVRGLRTDIVVVYRTVKAKAFPDQARAVLAAGEIDGVLHFSRRSVESYLDCARDLPAALGPIHFCLSARAGEPLRAAGATNIRIATKPDEVGLLALVTSRP